MAESIYQNLIDRSIDEHLPESVHLTKFPRLGAARDEPLEASMTVAMRAVELVRTLRAQAGIRTRQPMARLWLALPGGDIVEREALLSLVAEEVNVKAIELIGDESELVERRVKVLLPKVGKRLGQKIPEVMAAARDGRFEIHPDGSVTLAGVTVGADEVEIQASPKPGIAVAHDQGLVAVIDTELTPELIAEGDARELQRAIQDLRKDAGLALDDRIEVWVDGLPTAVAAHLAHVAVETLADAIVAGRPPDADPAIIRSSIDLSGGSVQLAIRRTTGVPA
jgi:isoleucyl-tRNA synthetase